MIKFNNNKSKNILKKIRENYEVIAIRKELLKYLAGMVAQEIEDIETNLVTSDFPKLYIPENHYYVLGDNRPVSNDSRYFGPVSKNDLN